MLSILERVGICYWPILPTTYWSVLSRLYQKPVQNPNIQSLRKTVNTINTDFSAAAAAVVMELEKRSYDRQRLNYYALGGGILLMFMFWRTIQSFVGKQASNVATTAINDQDVRNSVHRALQELAKTAQSDPEIQTSLAELMKRSMTIALQDQETLDQISVAAGQVVQSEPVRESSEKTVRMVLKGFWNKLW